jgi:hypothetical protein
MDRPIGMWTAKMAGVFLHPEGSLICAILAHFESYIPSCLSILSLLTPPPPQRQIILRKLNNTSNVTPTLPHSRLSSPTFDSYFPSHSSFAKPLNTLLSTTSHILGRCTSASSPSITWVRPIATGKKELSIQGNEAGNHVAPPITPIL